MSDTRSIPAQTLSERFSLLVEHLSELHELLGFRVTTQRLAIMLMTLEAPVDSTKCVDMFHEMRGVPRYKELERLRFRHGTYLQLRALVRCEAMTMCKHGRRSVYHLHEPMREVLEQALERFGESDLSGGTVLGRGWSASGADAA